MRLLIELTGMPGVKEPGSFWEVSYQLRIADQDAFVRWSNGGEDAAEQEKLGQLISKNSFSRRGLADASAQLPLPYIGSGYGLKDALVALARTDFEGATQLANRLAAPAARGVSLLDIASSVLEPKAQKRAPGGAAAAGKTKQ